MIIQLRKAAPDPGILLDCQSAELQPWNSIVEILRTGADEHEEIRIVDELQGFEYRGEAYDFMFVRDGGGIDNAKETTRSPKGECCGERMGRVEPEDDDPVGHPYLRCSECGRAEDEL